MSNKDFKPLFSKLNLNPAREENESYNEYVIRRKKCKSKNSSGMSMKCCLSCMNVRNKNRILAKICRLFFYFLRL